MTGVDEASALAATVPRRIVVTGSSTAYFVRPVEPRASYADVLGRAQGTTVVCTAEWLQTIDRLYTRIHPSVFAHRPDHLVLDVGFVESQPSVVPLPAVRWLYTWDPSLATVPAAVRRLSGRRLQREYLRWTPRLAARTGVPSRRPPDRLRRELDRFLQLYLATRGGPVALVDVPAVNARIEEVMPSINRRIEATNEVLADVASSRDEVELVGARTIVETDPDGLLPDGIHLSAEGHRLVAAAIEQAFVRVHDRIGVTPSP